VRHHRQPPPPPLSVRHRTTPSHPPPHRPTCKSALSDARNRGRHGVSLKSIVSRKADR
jgi:hypothetical protein